VYTVFFVLKRSYGKFDFWISIVINALMLSEAMGVDEPSQESSAFALSFALALFPVKVRLIMLPTNEVCILTSVIPILITMQ
jgi:hypothetical protein